jgi:hypothetical protein
VLHVHEGISSRKNERFREVRENKRPKMGRLFRERTISFSAVATHVSFANNMAARKSQMNHDALLQLVRARPTADRLLDAILAAGAEDGRTTVDDILADGEVPRRQAIILLRELESLGYGAFKVGRKGHPSRFEWSIDPADLEAVLDGGGEEIHEAGDAEIGQEASELEVAAGESEEFGRDLAVVQSSKRHSRGDIDHAYVLRPDYRVSLSLPDDLTRREAEVLSDWIRNLSFQR